MSKKDATTERYRIGSGAVSRWARRGAFCSGAVASIKLAAQHVCVPYTRVIAKREWVGRSGLQFEGSNTSVP
jgi:hypothetical protein